MDSSSKPRPATDPDLSPRPLSGAHHRGKIQGRGYRILDAAASACIELAALALPVECVACGAEDEALCARCRQRLRQLTGQPFRAEGNAAALMGFDGVVLLPVTAAGVYRDELARSILSFKRLGQRQLRDELGNALGRAITAGLPPGIPVCLVPVPTSPKAYRRRGFSPVHLLLSALKGRMGHVITAENLLRVRRRGWNTRSSGQKGLGRGDRASRVRGSMCARALRRHDIAGRHLMLVDDVLTTGATLAEAARVLHAAGGLVHGAVVVASAQPPGTDLRPSTLEQRGNIPSRGSG